MSKCAAAIVHPASVTRSLSQLQLSGNDAVKIERITMAIFSSQTADGQSFEQPVSQTSTRNTNYFLEMP